MKKRLFILGVILTTFLASSSVFAASATTADITAQATAAAQQAYAAGIAAGLDSNTAMAQAQAAANQIIAAANQAASSKQVTSTQPAKQHPSQVIAPSDAFVISRLQTIPTITGIEAVTETHDPNGLLNKQGGYIGCVYFSDSEVDASKVYSKPGDDIVDIGAIGGGAVEIFKTAAEANKRSAYLGVLDGTALTGGSHNVTGTIIIRTSHYLTATQQQNLTNEISAALLK